MLDYVCLYHGQYAARSAVHLHETKVGRRGEHKALCEPPSEILGTYLTPNNNTKQFILDINTKYITITMICYYNQ